MGSLALGVIALLLLDRRSTSGDLAAAGAVLLALGSSGVGIPVAIGVGVRLAWSRRDWAWPWVLGIPVGLYVLWYLVYGQPQGGLSNLTRLGDYG